MTLLTVFRVENATGSGPYTIVRQGALELARRHTDAGYTRDMPKKLPPGTAYLHPGPTADFGLRWERMTYTQSALNYRFGFASLDRAREWFYGEREVLDEMHMLVSTYEVPHQAVIRGQWQLAFRQQSARLVKTRTLQEAGIE